MPKLSVCTPTYNRAEFLDDLANSLRDLHDAGVEFELVVSDNASTDDTPAVMQRLCGEFDFIRYYRQARNHGGQANLIAAHRLARGDYVVYLADDDRLVARRIAEIIDFMDRSPEVAATVLPSAWWDYRKNGPIRNLCTVDEPVRFVRGNFEAAFLAFARDDMLPELYLSRREIVHKVAIHRPQAYFGYAWFTDFLDHGDVAMLPDPAYRSTWIFADGSVNDNTDGSRKAPDRVQEFRGGLEYCLLRAIDAHGLPPEKVASYRDMVDRIAGLRHLKLAHDCVQARRFRMATEQIRKWFGLMRLTNDQAMGRREIDRTMDSDNLFRPDLRRLIEEAAVAELAVEIFEQSPGLRRIVVLTDRSPNIVTETVSFLKPDVCRQTADLDEAARLGADGEALVIGEDAAVAAALAARGVHTGAVLSLTELRRQLSL